MSSTNLDLMSAIADAGVDTHQVEDTYLATPFQQGVLYAATRSQPPGRFFVDVYHIQLPPHTDLDRLHASWDIVVGAMSILRTGFILSAQGVLAVVYKTPHNAWVQNIQDKLEETGMQAAGLSFVQHLTFEPFSGHIPLAIHVVGNSTVGYHARFCFHHSISDGLSMVTLMKSLHTLYHQGLSPHTTSFALVAAAINSQSISIVKAAGDYWRQLVQDFPDALWPISSSPRSHPSVETFSRYCSIPEHNNPNFPAFRSRIIRAALALTMSVHSGLDDHLFCETRSSRSFLPPNLQHIPGPCLSSHLVRLRCGSSSTLEQLLSDSGIKQTTKVLKQCQMSLGQVLEAIGAQAAKKVRVFLIVYAAPFWPKNEDIPGWQFLVCEALYHLYVF